MAAPPFQASCRSPGVVILRSIIVYCENDAKVQQVHGLGHPARAGHSAFPIQLPPFQSCQLHNLPPPHPCCPLSPSVSSQQSWPLAPSSEKAGFRFVVYCVVLCFLFGPCMPVIFGQLHLQPGPMSFPQSLSDALIPCARLSGAGEG